MKYMLDTNICIYIIKKKPQSVLKKLTSISPEEVCISSVTLGELEYGVAKSQFPEKNKMALTAFLFPITVLPFDDCCAQEYGLIRAQLEREGNIIGPFDMQIAAHAKSQHLTLVTNNEKEFMRVKGLQIENWVS